MKRDKIQPTNNIADSMKIVWFLLAFYQFQIVICVDENDRLNVLENLEKELQNRYQESRHSGKYTKRTDR